MRAGIRFFLSHLPALGAATVLALASVSAQAQDGAGVTDGEIVIGQSCQLSGPLAALTSEVRQGASLYFDQVNAAGGVRGRKIRVVALDDAYDPKKAAENTRKLIDEEKVLALFQYACTPPALAGLAIAEERGVPTQEVGYYRLRFPTKPLTLGELASLPQTDDSRQAVVRLKK